MGEHLNPVGGTSLGKSGPEEMLQFGSSQCCWPHFHSVSKIVFLKVHMLRHWDDMDTASHAALKHLMMVKKGTMW